MFDFASMMEFVTRPGRDPHAAAFLFYAQGFRCIVMFRRLSKQSGNAAGLASVDPASGDALAVSGTCTVSAPGKALIAGGYLVTDRPNIGVVVAATSRFYSTVKQMPHPLHTSGVLSVHVLSPQFLTEYEYNYDVCTHSLRRVRGDHNEFIEKCLSLTLGFVLATKGADHVLSAGRIGVKLRADNDFYSQIDELASKGLPRLSANLATIRRFNPLPQNPDGSLRVAKTGMGSSAALTTSLVGSLLHFFKCISLPDTTSTSVSTATASGSTDIVDKACVHNLAQLAHAIAQGKVGSGFDVGSAVYGSILYRRFAPAPLKSCLDAGDELTLKTLKECVLDRVCWTQSIQCFSLPPGCDLAMGDVCGGSSTTSMTSAVKRWLKDDPTAPVLWSELAACNDKISRQFSSLSALADEKEVAYTKALSLLMALPSVDWLNVVVEEEDVNNIVNEWVTLRRLLKDSRRLLKSMGEQANVDIEPDDQTHLAEATLSSPGVLAAGVPGAGGVDAIYALTLGPRARGHVEKLWSEWSTRTVCPLLLSAQGQSDSTPGVRVESGMHW